MTGRVFYVGSSDDLARGIGTALGAAPGRTFPHQIEDQDVFFLQGYATADGGASMAALPGGNAFAASRAIKARARAKVYVLVLSGDSVSQEIARFCLADGALEVVGGALATDPRELVSRVTPHRRRVSVDSLLERLESDIRGDRAKQATALRKLLRPTPGNDLLDKLTDPETGLFDGAYAALKLDEEFKRAVRFHQPLSLVLLDIGPRGSLPVDPTARRTLFAEVASVFLNECRDIDILARFTESIFLFLLPGTGSEGAAVVTRRMLQNLKEKRFEGGVQLQPHAGLASVPAAGVTNRESFLVRAEACLLLAKDEPAADGLCADRD